MMRVDVVIVVVDVGDWVIAVNLCLPFNCSFDLLEFAFELQIVLDVEFLVDYVVIIVVHFPRFVIEHKARYYLVEHGNGVMILVLDSFVRFH